jgi:monofunctional glycosyltransferase
MPLRPALLARKASARTRATGGLGKRVRRFLIWALMLVLLVPLGLLVLFRFVPVPLTPLMVIRLAEGEELHKTWVPMARIAPALRQAVVAAEDNRFCEHSGFDWVAMGQVLDELRAGERPRGASTISMQTAKNLFLWPGRNLLRKGLEAWLTPQVELLWDKRRILEVYLNIVEMGPGIYGAEAAARHYFGKPAADLSPAQAARLAAVLPNPREWSPTPPSDYMIRRERTILRRIEQLGPMLDCTR